MPPLWMPPGRAQDCGHRLPEVPQPTSPLSSERPFVAGFQPRPPMRRGQLQGGHWDSCDVSLGRLAPPQAAGRSGTRTGLGVCSHDTVTQDAGLGGSCVCLGCQKVQTIASSFQNTRTGGSQLKSLHLGRGGRTCGFRPDSVPFLLECLPEQGSVVRHHGYRCSVFLVSLFGGVFFN